MIIVVNTKANFTSNEIIKYEKNIKKLNIIMCPSTCYLPYFYKGKYKLGVQDISEYEENNRTGENIAIQLKSLNVKYSIIGHSERKEYNNETFDTINNKINQAIKNDIIPIVCLDENYENELIKIINRYENKTIWFAYELKENIGCNCPELKDIENIFNNIKRILVTNEMNNSKILYGGGINEDNINYIKSIEYIDGILLSHNGLNIRELKKIYDIYK